jgi:hypothetical protein
MGECEKRLLFPMLRTIILPRQARDKHLESTQKRGGAFSVGPNIYREMNGEAAIEFAEATIGCRPGNARAAYLLPHIFSTPEFSVRVVSDVVGARKRLCLSHLCTKTDRYIETGSGQTQES